MNNSIAAYSGGSLPCAIGIIRISGDDSHLLFDRIFSVSNSRHIHGKLYYGTLLSKDLKPIDMCLGVKFFAPTSFTGENMCEIHCHGSRAVIEATLEHLFSIGATPAPAGEFTKRAFLNGKLDLTQTEAIADLIYANTLQSAQISAQNIKGTVKGEITHLQEVLSEIIAHFYALCDYTDEDIDPFEYEKTAATLELYAEKLLALHKSHDKYNAVNNGLPVALLGKPNTGKSMLFNALSRENRAIVTDLPGTTRDALDKLIICGGTPIRLYDTAGIRESSNPIEKLGIEKTYEIAGNAQAVIMLLDPMDITPEDIKIAQTAQSTANTALVINKCDLSTGAEIDDAISKSSFDTTAFSSIYHISAKTGAGIEALAEWLSGLNNIPQDFGAIISSPRQSALLLSAAQYLQKAAESARAGFTPDAFLSDAEAANNKLREITGAIASMDIAAEIFSRFCVGK